MPPNVYKWKRTFVACFSKSLANSRRYSVWQIGYNKDQFEADREVIRLAVRSGYSTYGTVCMFERIAKFHDGYVIKARTPGTEIAEVNRIDKTEFVRPRL